MLNFNNQPGTLSAEKSGGAITQSAGFLKRLLVVTLFCALSFMLSAPSLVQAEDLQEGTPAEQPSTNVQPVDTAAPAKLITSAAPETQAPAKANTQAGDGLEIGPEIIGQPVGAAVKAPTVNPVLYDDTTISGGNLAKARVNKKPVIATVHVTVKDKNGNEKATLSVTPTSGTTWKVDLPQGKKVEEGDTVTVYQQIGEDKSPEVNATAQPSKASTVTLTMPTGEIWVEEYTANVLNADEKAEAIDLLKKANPTIAKDIKSVEFQITGINPNKVASYVVTYTDNSKTGEIQAPGLTIKPVTETSRSPEIGSITMVDNVVKGKLPGPGPFDGIKVQLIVNVNKAKSDQYINDNKCKLDKDSSDPIGVTLKDDGSFSYTLRETDSLTLDQIVGVSVKEPHKFVSCSTTIVKPVKVEKIKVIDPRKVTAKDKEAIDAAIREAYIVNGESKLPNGTGDWDGVPAVIQIDDSGNVKIFSGNDVKGAFDPNNDYKFVPETNEDGSVKVNDGAEPKITIPAKDLLKNIKPEAPTLALSKDEKSIIITPNEKDTDAKIIAVSYKDKDGKDQTTTATKDDNGTWSITKGEGSVDQNGVVTLPKNKVKGETVVSATVTDKGGIADDDKDPLTSDPGTITVKETKADKVEALGGLDPVALKKWVGDEVDWKNGVKAKDDAKKDEVEELLKGATFEDVTEEKRNTSKEGDFEGKIKITFDDKSELVVEKQMLYVSNHVTSMERKDKVPTDALDVEFKLGEGTKVDNTGSGAIEGNKDNPTSYSKYKVKPNTNLKEYKIPAINASAVDSIKLSAQDGYTDPTWNTNDFVATTKNNVFTATATKLFKVTVQANGGSGDDKVETKKSGEKYTLPKKDTFTPPENQEFAGWLVGDTTTTTKPGTEITITGDTVIKASWKPIMVNVSFDKGKGSGNKDTVSVAKGSKYALPDSEGFTPPENQKFAGWEVNGKVVAAGTEITVDKDTTVTAIWEKIPVTVTYDANGGKGTMEESKTLYKGDTYKVLASTFTAPENQEFDYWEIDGKKVAADTEITLTKDTAIKAIWKDIMVHVNFEPGEGSGTMGKESVKKGSKFKLPASGFTPPSGKEFNGWKVGDRTYKVGESIPVNGDVTVTAIWKDKPASSSTTPGKAKPGKQGKSQPQNPAAGGNLSRTGANGMYSLYASLLLLATGGLFLISRRRRNQR